MSDLQEEVRKLQEQVKKLQVLLASTGQQVMQLQMESRRTKLSEIDSKTEGLQDMVPAAKPASSSSSSTRPSEYVTESDLGDMVVELQGQLTLIDERNIRRILNSRSSSKLVALPNADGEYSPEFPKTIFDLQTLTDEQLFDQWNFFEMLPNGEKLDDLIEPETTPQAKEGNAKVMNEIYESVARYIGLNAEEYPRKAVVN